MKERGKLSSEELIKGWAAVKLSGLVEKKQVEEQNRILRGRREGCG